MDNSAIQVIDRYWYTAPVNVVGVIKDLGIEFKRFVASTSLEDISGYIEKDGDRYIIAVNGFDHPVRQRFTAAHELGHYIYHRPLMGDGIDDTRMYRSEAGGKFYNTNIGPTEEKQANTFAANLLMPKHLIKELRSQGFRTSKELAERLNVSLPAMEIKLGRFEMERG